MKFRAAWEKVRAVIGNVMDYDRVRSISYPGSPFAQVYLEAADVIAEAEGLLYKSDKEIVRLIAGEGCALKDVAKLMCDPPTDRIVSWCATRLRAGLTAMADKWEIDPEPTSVVRRAHIYSFRDFDSMAMKLTGEAVVRGNVVQADRRGVKVLR